MKEKIIISACLLGFDCKYNGGNNRMEDAAIAALRKRFELIPVCPECCGGLPTPRTPSERLGDRVVSKTGADVTEQFEKGALATLSLAQSFSVKAAVLKSNSPSCGSGQIYDGTFSSTVVAGDGITAALLKKNGIAVFGESQTGELE